MSTQYTKFSKSVYCILCGNREKSVSYHAFPKQKEIRQQWIAFCRINEDVLNTATRLCSNHFHENLKKQRGKGVVLSSNAVPSIRMKKKEKSKQTNSVLNEVHDNIIQKAISPVYMSHTETVDSSSTKAERLLEDINNRPSTPMEDEATLCSNYQTPTKIIHNPRFVNEIRTPHLATPRKARRALQLAKWTIAQQNRKIKTLQQAQNRLVARVTTMKGVIKHLKQKNLLSEAAAEHLQVFR